MDPVRLALDVGPRHGHRTGVGVAVAALADALSAHPGVEVTPYVVSFGSRPEPPVRRFPLPAALGHRLWSMVDRPRLDRWFGDAQVVHGTNYTVPPTSRPRIVSVYDCWFLANPELASPLARRAGDVLRRAVRTGAMVHASSEATADRLHELLGAERVEVIHLGPPPVPADPDDGVSLELGRAPFVLALATWERRKNLPHLVNAFGRADLGETTLVLAGADGDDTDAVCEAVLGLPEKVRRRVLPLGRIDDDTKAWLLRHAAALAYPSLDEGFGFPILEAQAVDVPVVATRAGSIPEVAGAGAELVPVDDLDALAAGLQRVVIDDGRREQLTAAGRSNLRRFSWEKTADAMVDLYRRVVHGA